MIKVSDGKIEMHGPTSEVMHDYLVLTHAFVEGVMPYMPEDIREHYKTVIALAITEGFGMDTLAECGLIKGFSKVDLSGAANLKRRADDETD